jgi:hypothetical protein
MATSGTGYIADDFWLLTERDTAERLLRALTEQRAEEAVLIDHLGGVVSDLKRRIRVRKARGIW